MIDPEWLLVGDASEPVNGVLIEVFEGTRLDKSETRVTFIDELVAGGLEVLVVAVNVLRLNGPVPIGDWLLELSVEVPMLGLGALLSTDRVYKERRLLPPQYWVELAEQAMLQSVPAARLAFVFGKFPQ